MNRLATGQFGDLSVGSGHVFPYDFARRTLVPDRLPTVVGLVRDASPERPILVELGVAGSPRWEFMDRDLSHLVNDRCQGFHPG